jgi:hypothetical protein
VFDNEPGSEFERDLNDGEERALLGVHLAIVEPEPLPVPVPIKPARRATKRTRNPESEE